MRIAIFNWRDIRNPKSGGAEIVTHEYARGWVKAGHRVALISPAFPECKKREVLDGVEIIRLGLKSNWNFLLIYLLAFFYYQINLKNKIDLVVDEIHGLPFFTPLYVKEKKIVFICEVAGEIWKFMYSKLIAFLGKIIENNYFKLYQGIKFLTISESTKKDLIHKGVKKENICIIYPGINVKPPDKIPRKEDYSTFIYLNRICRMKNLKDTIVSFGLINKQLAQARLWIVGYIDDRKYYDECRKLIDDLKIKGVKFYGYVRESEKYELLSGAHILVHTSIKEGWGINVLEANAFAVPCIGYNTHGLREAIIQSKTGLLCEKNNPKNIAKLAVGLVSNKEKYKKMQKACLVWSKRFTWEKATAKSLELLKTI